ncbi:MAG: CYTH domain-containing protein [Oscillospiraceae bacterium]|nr:CYTH domain-containing protein [Oscillospiraceae bacterium]
MGREFELKFRASVRQMDAIRADFEGFREINMVSTYFDTPDRALAPLHWTLRQRMENETSVCTLKTPAGDGSRSEWETECADIGCAIEQLCSLGAPGELKALVSGGLEAVCGARFIRQAALINTDGCTVELALDRGILRGGARIELLGEVEVELKAGSEEAAVAFARTLAAKYGLIPERASKYKRALALTGRF